MNELLQALAQEIRQTSLWLAGNKSPDVSSIRFRLHTLREAAATANMKSVETTLGRIESRLDSSEPQGLDEILKQLSELLLAVARPITGKGSLRLAELDRLEDEFRLLLTSMDKALERLSNLSLLVNSALLDVDETDSTEKLMELSKAIKDEIAGAQKRQSHARRTIEELHRLSGALMKEFSANSWIPMDPALSRLRQKVRKWSKANTKPIALKCNAHKVRVGVQQYEDVLDLIDKLLDEIMTKALDDPEARNRSGKPTVAGIEIEGKVAQDLVRLAISHDGSDMGHSFFLPPSVKATLKKLRARMWIDESQEVGQRLLIYFPLWQYNIEVVKIRCEIGEVFVPVSVIQGVYKTLGEADKNLSEIHLDRRAGSHAGEHFPSELVLFLDNWQKRLPCNIMAPAKRKIVNLPGEKDPMWVLGKAGSGNGSCPVIHPLAFMSTPEQYRLLYPVETKP